MPDKTVILQRGGNRRLLAPGPETVDEEWQLSKDSADAATAVETEPGIKSDEMKCGDDQGFRSSAGREEKVKKQNQNCNRAFSGAGIRRFPEGLIRRSQERTAF